MEINPIIAEIWTLCAIATLLIAARVFCRARLVGVAGFRPDDYLVFLAWALYTSVCVMATLFTLVSQGRHTSLLTPEQRRTMPESELYVVSKCLKLLRALLLSCWASYLWEYGSKNFVAGMCIYVSIVWTLKFHMLFFYRRLVAGQWVEKFIFPVMGLVGATAIAIVFIIALTCRPLSKMWQIRPDPGENCVPQNKVYFFSILSMNVVTDLCIIAIPIPVLSLVRASVWRKIGVYFLFGLGVFCIMAAIIRVILIFHPTGQFGPGAMWSLREDFVAIFVGQAPMIVPLFKKKFWTQKGYRYTPKSSQRSDGIEMSSGASNPNKKPRDPFSLTQLGFTHITNLTRATQNTQTDVTAVAKHSSEALAVTEEEIAEPSQDGIAVQGIMGGVENGTKNSLEISVVPVVTNPDAAGSVDGKNG